MMDRLARLAEFPVTREDAVRRGCCVRCEDPIGPDWTTTDLREWALSRLCGACFDAITYDVEDEPESAA